MNYQDIKLPVVINGHAFTANADGMWDLTGIHKALGLPDNKRPGQWSNAIQRELHRCGNFNIVHGDNGGTLATEAGTIAYAMWVSTEFYLMVIHAFVSMRNSAIRDAKAKDAVLAANMPKATTLDRKAAGAGLTWTEACRVAGIQHPALALKYLHSVKRFVRSVDNFGTPDGPVRPPKKAFDLGHFVVASGDFGNREGWRVKPGGLDWLARNTEDLNTKVTEAKRAKAAKQRHTKAQAKRVTA